MLKRIKDINEALPGMLLIECIYLVVAQIIIFIAVPNKIMCAVGLLAGCLYAVFSSFHLSFTIRKVVYGGHKQSSTLVFGYIVRFLVMIILLALLYIFKAGDLLCAIIGMFSEKIAAYLSPLLDKKRSAKGENSTGELPQTDKNIIEKESESVGSESLTTMVAGDSSFMIKTLYTFKLNGVSLNIDTTHVALLLVSVFILVMAVIARIKINKVDASDTPGMFQNVIEIIVEMLGTMVDGIMGKNANKFVNYISTLFLFIIISNISGLFGLRPPTADYGVTLCLGLITFILVQFNGIKKNRIKHFTALFQPIWFLFPINLIGEFAVPLSLSLRLFGNVMSGTVLMGLIYDLLSPFTVAYPAVLHAYFDLFSGCIQAYVFCMLTMVYVNDKIAD